MNSDKVTLDQLHFTLPEHLIAQRPAQPRDAAKLLVYNRASGHITDAIFRDINQFLPTNTTLTLNNAKVDKCRFRFDNKEIFALETFNNRTVQAMVKPGPKFKLDRQVELAPGISAKVIDINPEGLRTLEFNCNLDNPKLTNYSLTPLPPYIAQDEQLAEEYQTVYATQQGSKAAPTAGLHFTPHLLASMKQTHPVAELTLHVGLGTFAPLKQDNLDSQTLHSENYIISEEAAQTLNQANHITAVGTTSIRTLESAVGDNRRFQPIAASTNIFIQPGYTFQATDAVITNFHLPSTSLLLLIGAFMGPDELMRCYHHAIQNHYRFYSFGDAMLIL